MSGDPTADDDPPEETAEESEPSDSHDSEADADPDSERPPAEDATDETATEADETTEAAEKDDEERPEADELAPQVDLMEGWKGIEGPDSQAAGESVDDPDETETDGPEADGADVTETEDDDAEVETDDAKVETDDAETETDGLEAEADEPGAETDSPETDGDVAEDDDVPEDEPPDESADDGPTADALAQTVQGESEEVEAEDDGEDGPEGATASTPIGETEEDEDEEGDEDQGEEGDVEDEDEDEDDGYDPVEMHDDATPIQRKTGPEYDQEQPLADHIEEMIKRLAVVVVVAGLVSLLAFPFGEDFITFLWYSVLPEDISQPHVYHPLELVITQLKAASLLGLVIALPVFVYETYLFMRPGLYPHERRYYLAAVPTSLILAFVGLLFGYFLVLPAVMTYFLYYSEGVVDIAFALGQTFNLMLILLGYLALVFQIPLFIMLAIMMGLTSRQWLEDRRLIFWGAFLGISFLFSPDPTGMAPILIAATMIVLFEGTLLLLRWTRRG